jgi:hypothetical protein
MEPKSSIVTEMPQLWHVSVREHAGIRKTADVVGKAWSRTALHPVVLVVAVEKSLLAWGREVILGGVEEARSCL